MVFCYSTAISVKIQGKAKTLWKECGHRQNKYSFEQQPNDLNEFKNRLNHTGKEKYFESNIILLGGKGKLRKLVLFNTI